MSRSAISDLQCPLLARPSCHSLEESSTTQDAVTQKVNAVAPTGAAMVSVMFITYLSRLPPKSVPLLVRVRRSESPVF